MACHGLPYVPYLVKSTPSTSDRFFDYRPVPMTCNNGYKIDTAMSFEQTPSIGVGELGGETKSETT